MARLSGRHLELVTVVVVAVHIAHEPILILILVRLVVLLAVAEQALLRRVRVRRIAGGVLLLPLFAAGPAVKLLEKVRVCLAAVLAFRMHLSTLLLTTLVASLRHSLPLLQ